MNVVEAPPTFERRLAMGLLRLADDSEQAIATYVDEGRLFLLMDASSTGSVPPVGQLLVLQPGVSQAEIRSVSIAVPAQGQGFGRRLVESALATLKREGVRRVTVATSTADIANIAFYQKIGFRPLSIERDAFTVALGYREDLRSDGMLARDKIWFDREL